MNKKNTAILVSVVLVLGIAIGYGIFHFTGGNTVSKTVSRGNIPGAPIVAGMSRTVSGVIQSIGSNSLTVKFIVSATSKAPEVREVLVTSSTQIVKLERKDAAEFKKEQADYRAAFAIFSKNPVNFTLPIPPRSSNEVKINLSDLKIGDRVSVQNKEGSDALSAKFEAVKISLQLQQTAPTLPAGQ